MDNRTALALLIGISIFMVLLIPEAKATTLAIVYQEFHYDQLADMTGTGQRKLNTTFSIDYNASIEVDLNQSFVLGSSATFPIPTSATYNTNATTMGIWVYFPQASTNEYFIRWLNYSGGGEVGFCNRVVGGQYHLETFYTSAGVGGYDYYDTGILIADLVGAWHYYEITLVRIHDASFLLTLDGSTVDVTPHTVIDEYWTCTGIFITDQTIPYGGYFRIQFDDLQFKDREEFTYPSPPSTGGGGTPFNILDVQNKLASRLNVNIFIAGLIISLVMLIFAELPFLIFDRDAYFIQAVVGTAVLGTDTFLGFLPTYTFILITIMVVLLFVDVIRHRVW